MVLNGRKISANSVVMEDVDFGDFPDFSDAYIAHATFVDGTPLNDEELEQLTEEYGNELAHEGIS